MPRCAFVVAGFVCAGLVLTLCAPWVRQMPRPSSYKVQAPNFLANNKYDITVASPTQIHLLTVNTLSPSTTISVRGVPGWTFENLGVGAKWVGSWTKVHLYLQWLQQHAPQAPNDIVILTDSTDVGFGGCSKKDLLARYQSVSQASEGAQVIAGADTHIWPPALWRNRTSTIENFNRFESRRLTLLQAFGMDASVYGGTYKYANSGFLMGPASVLLNVVSCMFQKGRGSGPYGGDGAIKNFDPWFDDQYGLILCMFQDTSPRIAVDYSGSIVLDMYGLDANLPYAKDGAVYNRATNTAQCFIHGNGHSFAMSQLDALAR